MSAPRYMRFFPDTYLADTLSLNMEEQGIYMRLLCLMWTNGAKIRKEDRIIARMLGIHRNKWLKVKPRIIPFLTEYSSGYLTQTGLRLEYKYAVDKSKRKDGTTHDTPQDTTPDTYGVTPIDTPQVVPQNSFENQEPSKNPLDQSKSRFKDKNRFLDDDAEKICGKLESNFLPPERAEAFINALLGAFDACRITPPPDYEVIRSWIENGLDPFRHILPTIQEILQRIVNGTHAPPRSWKYFAKEIYQQSNKRRK